MKNILYKRFGQNRFWGALIMLLTVGAVCVPAPLFADSCGLSEKNSLRFTVYEQQGRVYLSVPADGSICRVAFTAQIDSGMGFLDYGLKAAEPVALYKGDIPGALCVGKPESHTVSSYGKWVTEAMKEQNSLQMPPDTWEAREEDNHMIVDITDRLLQEDFFYTLEHKELTQEVKERAKVLGVMPVENGFVVRVLRYFMHLPVSNADETLKFSGEVPVVMSVSFQTIDAMLHTPSVISVSDRMPSGVVALLQESINKFNTKCIKDYGPLRLQTVNDITAATPVAVSYDVTGAGIWEMQQRTTQGKPFFARLFLSDKISESMALSYLLGDMNPDSTSSYDAMLKQAGNRLKQEQIVKTLFALYGDTMPEPNANTLSEIATAAYCSLVSSQIKELQDRAHLYGKQIVSEYPEQNEQTLSKLWKAYHRVVLNDMYYPVMKRVWQETDPTETKEMIEWMYREMLLENKLQNTDSASLQNMLFSAREARLAACKASWNLFWNADHWISRMHNLLETGAKVSNFAFEDLFKNILESSIVSDEHLLVRQACLTEFALSFKELSAQKDASIENGLLYLRFERLKDRMEQVLNRKLSKKRRSDHFRWVILKESFDEALHTEKE